MVNVNDEMERIIYNQSFIETLREKRGISKEEIVSEMGITKSRYNRLIAGKTKLKVAEFIRVCTLLS